MKRGTDHTWESVKYKGDVAFYFLCKCGFYYCYKEFIDQPIRFYRYCPYCGARKKWYTNEPRKIDKYRW